MSTYTERLVVRLREENTSLSHEAATEIEALKRDAELYRHMLAVARANGHRSLTEAICDAKK